MGGKQWATMLRKSRNARAAYSFPSLLGQNKNWTQSDLARALAVSKNTVARWERGEFMPSRQSMRMLAYASWIALARVDPRGFRD